MRRLCLSLVLVLAGAVGLQGQITVTDVATTTQSRIAAIVQE